MHIVKVTEFGMDHVKLHIKILDATLKENSRFNTIFVVVIYTSQNRFIFSLARLATLAPFNLAM